MEAHTGQAFGWLPPGGNRCSTRGPEGDLHSIAAQVTGELLARMGADRLLWGRDAPCVGYGPRVDYGHVLESVKKLGARSGDPRANLPDGAEALFSLTAGKRRYSDARKLRK